MGFSQAPLVLFSSYTGNKLQAALLVGILNSPAISVVWYYLICTSAVSIFFHAHAHLNSITQLLYYFQTHGAWYEIILHQPVCRRACLDVCLNMEWLQYVSLVFGLHTFGVEMIVFICLPFFFLNPVYICGRAVPAIFVDLVREKREIMKYMSKYYTKPPHETGTVTFVM